MAFMLFLILDLILKVIASIGIALYGFIMKSFFGYTDYDILLLLS